MSKIKAEMWNLLFCTINSGIGKVDYDLINISLEYKNSDYQKDILYSEFEFTEDEYINTILTAKVSTNDYEINQDIIQANIEDYTIENISKDLGIIHLEMTDKEYGKDILSANISDLENKEYNKNILSANLSIEKELQTTDLSSKFMNKRNYFNFNTLFSKVEVPYSYSKEISISLTVDNSKKFFNKDLSIMNFHILERYKNYDVTKFRFEVEPQEYYEKDLNCILNINQNYYEKDLDCKFNINIKTYNLDIDSSIAVKALYNQDLFSRTEIVLKDVFDLISTFRIKTDFYKDTFSYFTIPFTYEYDDTAFKFKVINEEDQIYKDTILDCNVQVYTNIITKNLKSRIRVKGKYGECSHCIKKSNMKIMILVSPLWMFEPYVFKSSLITFFDRYIDKFNLELLYSGTPRGDFDITNIALNYGIRLEDLHRVPIEYKRNEYENNYRSINHFIHHMTKFNNRGERINRVFVYMNNPLNWRNDPLYRIIRICLDSNISIVGIGADGDYYELNDTRNLDINCMDKKFIDYFENEKRIVY